MYNSPMPLINIAAPIAGTLKEVLVAAGDAVGEGQELFILESMKMEIPVESPAAGAVAEILVEAGRPVEEGDILARLSA